MSINWIEHLKCPSELRRNRKTHIADHLQLIEATNCHVCHNHHRDFFWLVLADRHPANDRLREPPNQPQAAFGVRHRQRVRGGGGGHPGVHRSHDRQRDHPDGTEDRDGRGPTRDHQGTRYVLTYFSVRTQHPSDERDAARDLQGARNVLTYFSIRTQHPSDERGPSRDHQGARYVLMYFSVRTQHPSDERGPSRDHQRARYALTYFSVRTHVVLIGRLKAIYIW